MTLDEYEELVMSRVMARAKLEDLPNYVSIDTMRDRVRDVMKEVLKELENEGITEPE